MWTVWAPGCLGAGSLDAWLAGWMADMAGWVDGWVACELDAKPIKGTEHTQTKPKIEHLELTKSHILKQIMQN